MFSKLSFDNKFEKFIKILETSHNMQCKIKSKNVPTEKLASPWMRDYIENILSEKHWLHRLSVSIPQYEQIYVNHTKLMKKTIFIAKSITFQIKLHISNDDSKSTWKT